MRRERCGEEAERRGGERRKEIEARRERGAERERRGERGREGEGKSGGGKREGRGQDSEGGRELARSCSCALFIPANQTRREGAGALLRAHQEGRPDAQEVDRQEGRPQEDRHEEEAVAQEEDRHEEEAVASTGVYRHHPRCSQERFQEFQSSLVVLYVDLEKSFK